jgi:hypothetical protein
MAMGSASQARADAGWQKFVHGLPDAPWAEGLVEWLTGKYLVNAWDSATEQAHIALQPPLPPGVERSSGGGRPAALIDPERLSTMLVTPINDVAQARGRDEWARLDRVRNDYVNGVTDNLDALTA